MLSRVFAAWIVVLLPVSVSAYCLQVGADEVAILVEAHSAKPADVSDLNEVTELKAELQTIRQLLRRLVHTVPSSRVAAQAETARAAIQAINDQIKNAETARLSEGSELRAEATMATDCTALHGCKACVDGGCAWCVSARLCVPDEAWACKEGEEGHVGRVGQLKQCPTPPVQEPVSAPAPDPSTPVEAFCVGWRQTGGCDPEGGRESDHDKDCDATIENGASGYCECAFGQRKGYTCAHDAIKCRDVCAELPSVSVPSSEAACSNHDGENKAYGRPISSSSSSQDHGPAFVADGSNETSWQSERFDEAKEHWISVELAQPINFHSIVVLLQSGLDAPPLPCAVSAKTTAEGPWVDVNVDIKALDGEASDGYARLVMTTTFEQEPILTNQIRLTCVATEISIAEILVRAQVESKECNVARARARAQAKLSIKSQEELERIRTEQIQENPAASQGQEGSETAQKQKHREAVLERARMARESTGATRPYEVMELDRSATQSEIRSAYRTLSLAFHPDKNDPSLKEDAQRAFADIVAAYEILGNPDKRAAFDDFGSGSADGFQTQWEWQQSGQKGDSDFYTGHTLITMLTEKLWHRRVTENSIWIVEFYAAWCVHCQRTVNQWKGAAVSMQDENIEFGAVNCVKEKTICQNWFNIQSYPTVMMMNEKFSVQQVYHGSMDTDSIVNWARGILGEWQWLFSRSNIHTLDANSFVPQVMESTTFWVVLFSEGFECGPCRSAKTNMMRLSASLVGLVSVGVIDCSLPENKDFCYGVHKLPAPPHSPQIKAFRSGTKSPTDLGEDLFDYNNVEPHLALQIVERAIRLSAADKAEEAALTLGKQMGWDEYKEPADDSPPPPPPPPQWNGQARVQRALPWNNAGAPRAPRLTHHVEL